MAQRRPVRLLAVLVVGVAVVGVAVWGIVKLTKPAPQQIVAHCTVGGYDLDTDQASVAAQMVGEVYKSGIAHQERAAVLALAAALQESKLENIPPGDGDRDSVGVLQQRPSQDWGKARYDSESDTIAARTQRLTDVTEATREFLAKLQDFDNWWTLPAATAIQNVQISADGSLYAQHEPEATTLAAALLGTDPAGITCQFDAPTVVAKTSDVVADFEHQLGLTTPVATAQAVRVPGAAWQSAAWFVANADRYGIASVEYGGRTWTPDGGWRKSDAGTSSVLAVMAQLPNK